MQRRRVTAAIPTPMVSTLLLLLVLLLAPPVPWVAAGHGSSTKGPKPTSECPGGRNKITAHSLVLRGQLTSPCPSTVPSTANPSVLESPSSLGLFVQVILSSFPCIPQSIPSSYGSLWLVVNTAFSAAALYDYTAPPAPRSKPTLESLPTALGSSILDTDRTIRNQNIAVAFAHLGISRFLSPVTMAGYVTGVLKAYNLDEPKTEDCAKPLPSLEPSKRAACVGLAVAAAAIAASKEAGWNLDGCTGQEFYCAPFNDYSRSYKPKNDVFKLRAIHNWQPLMETNGQGNFWAQIHASPYVPLIKPFTISSEELKKRTLPRSKPNATQYRAQVDEILKASAALDDRSKMLAEYFQFSRWIVEPLLKFGVRGGQATLLQALAYAQFASAFHDAFIVFFSEKLRHDRVRPLSAVRYVYGGQKVDAYRGLGKGTGPICGNEWLPYLRTNPDSEFPSGQVCTCTIYAEWMKKFHGSDAINQPYSFSPGSSLVEPGTTPKEAVQGIFATTGDFLKGCQKARIDAGVHFKAATEAAVELCQGMGDATYDWLRNYFPLPA